MSERTFALLKPEALERGLVGEIIRRIESSGFEILALKMLKVSGEQAKVLYRVHKGKPFYEKLVKHISSGPVVCMVLAGKDAVNKLRGIVGATDPAEAKPGTIRGDLGVSLTENMIHAADSRKAVEEEVAIFFNEEEILAERHQRSCKR
jgi:nucleoside-diphosphate kinase